MQILNVNFLIFPFLKEYKNLRNWFVYFLSNVIIISVEEWKSFERSMLSDQLDTDTICNDLMFLLESVVCAEFENLQFFF